MGAAQKDGPSHGERAHARFAPSDSKRWLHCTGAIPLEEELLAAGKVEPKPNTVYTLSGTACHEASELVLAGEIMPSGPIKVTDPEGHVEPFEVPEDEWRPHVENYVDVIHDLMLELSLVYGKERVVLEIEIKVQIIKGEVWGSLDCSVSVLGEELHILDLKAGMGVIVDVEENPQFLTYAAGKAMKDDWNYKRCTLHCAQIANENSPHSTWDCSMADLKAHLGRVKLAVHAANDPDLRRLKAGEWCRWCVCKQVTDTWAGCPEHVKQVTEVFDDMPMEGDVPMVPAETEMTTERMIWLVKHRQVISDYLDLAQQQLQSMAERGTLPEDSGFKLVRSVTRRKWNPDMPEAQIAAGLKAFGIDPYARKLIPISAAEKQLGKGGADMYTIKPEGRPVLVPDTDRRKAITSADVFD